MRLPPGDVFVFVVSRTDRLKVPLAVLATIILATTLAPVIAPYDPMAITGEPYQPPTREHLFGTDTLGRDVLSRTLFGGQQSLSIVLIGVAIIILPGTVLGMSAGFYGQWTDRLLMASMDILLAFPNLLLALVIITLLGSGGWQIAIAVGIAGLPAYARIARTATATTRNALYIDAARAIGVRSDRLLSHHLLPNVLPLLLSFAAVSLSWTMLNSAALAFLGFGGDPSVPNWGVMLAEARYAFRVAPWMSIPPGLAITATVMAVNRLADASQERFRNRT